MSHKHDPDTAWTNRISDYIYRRACIALASKNHVDTLCSPKKIDLDTEVDFLLDLETLKGPVGNFSSPAFLREFGEISYSRYLISFFFNASYMKNYAPFIPACPERKIIDYVLTVVVSDTKNNEVVYVDRIFGNSCISDLSNINHEVFTIARPFRFIN